MTIDAPQPILDYFNAKNSHDIDGMIAAFAEDAAVTDEGETYQGRAAIRAWMEETTRKYKVTSRPQSVEDQDGALIVTSIVSGDFPGSPARLNYRFTLQVGAVARLEIG